MCSISQHEIAQYLTKEHRTVAHCVMSRWCYDETAPWRLHVDKTCSNKLTCHPVSLGGRTRTIGLRRFVGPPPSTASANATSKIYTPGQCLLSDGCMSSYTHACLCPPACLPVDRCLSVSLPVAFTDGGSYINRFPQGLLLKEPLV